MSKNLDSSSLTFYFCYQYNNILALDIKIILGSSIISGLLLGLIVDKIKSIKKNGDNLKGIVEIPALQRKNSLRKYTQRKNSGVPVS